jgi:hypothetical protein
VRDARGRHLDFEEGVAEDRRSVSHATRGEKIMRLKRSAATFACLSALAGSVLGGGANADPGNSGTVTYDFTQCVASSGGSVPDFQAVKEFGQAAALHLLNGSGNFIAMEAVVLGDQTVNGTFYADGTVLFSTPGFSGPNGLPTITCTNTSPVSGITARVTGYIAPS